MQKDIQPRGFEIRGDKMNITIDKAADVVVNANVLKRVFMNPKEKRYCAKCKTELSWYYAENANYIFSAKIAKQK